MNKEPIGLYIFRYIVGMGLLAFMGMLYWSSVLVENNLKNLRTDIGQVRTELFNLQNSNERLRTDLMQQLSTSSQIEAKPSFNALQKVSSRPHIDENLPNLLSTDPFFTETLPKMLPAGFVPQGTYQQTTIRKPDNLHPFSNWANVRQWAALCTISLAQLKFGIYETYAPNMAIKVEERIDATSGEPEYWIHLRENVFWQPLKPSFFSNQITLAPVFLRKHPVTAHDFKFFYDAMMNPYNQQVGAASLRIYYTDIEKFEVIDDLTLVVKWQMHEIKNQDGTTIKRAKYLSRQLTGGLSPLARFIYQYFPDGQKIIAEDSDPNTYRENSVWAQNFAIHWAQNIIASCGPWKFDGMTDRVIQFTRNADYYTPYNALMERQEFEFKNTTDAEWQSFKNGISQTYELDASKVLELKDFLASPEYQEQVAKGMAIKQLEYLGNIYQYIGWNQKMPFFKSKKVRQALTMAIDRNRIIRQNLNGLGQEINGTFAPNSSAYNHQLKPWPFDPERARRLLAEDGWEDHDGDGILDKEIDGVRVPFRFDLTYYVKQTTAKSIVEYIATALKEIGVVASLNGVDVADLSNAFDSKSFEAIYLGWALGTPPEDPRQLWSSKGAKEKGSSNGIGFENAEVDQIIDALDYEYDPAKRIALYHRFDEIIYEEAPYTFLFAPKIKLLYREEVQNVFLPIDRQDLIPGANIAIPDSSIFWFKRPQP
ncbi:MAG: permease [Parachlamydia sp.]|nr:MAG: permease [Parachlamydia sp.]